MRGGRRDLLEQLQPFRRNAVFELGKAGDVASRPGQAFDDTEADRVDRLSKYDRNAAIRLQERHDRDTGRGEDNVRPSATNLGHGREDVRRYRCSSGSRSAGFDQPSSPPPASPAQTPQCDFASRRRRHPGLRVRRRAGRVLARAPRAATSPPPAEQRDELAARIIR